MIRLITPLLLFLLCSTLNLNAALVTFNLNMNEVANNFSVPEVNGTFNGWCGACAIMTDPESDGIWTISIELAPGTYEYKYAYDNWAGQETLLQGMSCTVTNAGFTNRILVVGAEDLVLDPVCWASCLDCGLQPGIHNVTFNLNMNEVQEPFGTPEVNGTFNNWCGACAPMSDPDLDGIWTITIPLSEGTYEFKYAYDNWAGQETLTEGMPCTLTTGPFTNRIFTVSNEDINMEPVCWGSCQDCGVAPITYDVTFRLNMNEVAEPFTTPEVNGTFNNWCGSCAAMSDVDADGIWEITIALEAGNYEYKYSYDNWAGQEILLEGMPCTITSNGFTNRTLSVIDENIALNSVCWSSCEDCGAEPTLYDVHFMLNMNEVAEPFTTPEVNGTFNGWCGGCAPMSDPDMDGIWELTIALAPGNYEFKYAYDNWAGQENLMEGMSCTVTNNGFTNRAFSVNNGSVDLGTVCWNSCENCGVEPVTYNVHFSVDMNQVVEPFTTPEINGTFNGWCGACAPMSDPDMDGIWELSIALAPGTYEFKYAYDNWAGQENLMEGMPCTVTNNGFTNRTFTVLNQDLNLGFVCWGACTDCESQPELFDVHFTVDMNEVTEPFTTPEVNGTFNNWCGGCAPMSDADADGVWELTIPLAPGTYEFKYAYDSWAGQENLTPGLSCTMTTDIFTNRVFTVTDSDLDLGEVCWASCNPCEEAPELFNVTFYVDMQDYLEPFTTPEVNGTFNNWCGNCAAMSDLGAGLWSITIPLAAGTYEYKFSYDNWAGQEEFEGGESCTITTDGFTNRLLVVEDSDVELTHVCFESCSICPLSIDEETQLNFNIYPNPVSGGVLNIQFANSYAGIAQIDIYDVTGKLTSSFPLNLSGGYAVLPIDKLSSGLYKVRLNLNGAVVSESLIIE